MSFEKFRSSIVIFTLMLLVVSCAGGRKHMEEGEKLERSGMYIEANKEFIRALKATSDKQERANLQMRIANNYQKANQNSDAITYYKQAIETSNAAGLPAPYQKLAECYLVSGQVDAAAALISEAEQIKTVDYRRVQAEIARAISLYLESQPGRLSDAIYYCEQFLKYANETKDEALIQEAKLKLNNLKAKETEKK